MGQVVEPLAEEAVGHGQPAFVPILWLPHNEFRVGVEAYDVPRPVREIVR